MIKKIYIIIFILSLITSCGKKNDPIYKENGKNFENNKIKVLL
jgi:major membrane immunogen (membrane-anchored lipoprotein)|tara:strand:+ start:1044 stop:1172 length:129 start_codon:yes stop_codon:yes gene_type:complete